MRDRLIELLNVYQDYGTKHTCGEWTEEISSTSNEIIADYLIENGVIVTPCVAMVEQVLKDGKIDRPKTLHCAGKYSVVYIDKSKWRIPLIDITEQCYNDEKALERIQALKGGAE